MVKKLLCFIDLHNWEYVEEDTGEIINKGHLFLVTVIKSYEICLRCNKVKNRILKQRIKPIWSDIC